MDDFVIVERYLANGEYPVELSKGEKANLWRKCRNFKLEDGLHYYRKASSEVQWKKCVRSEEERRRIIESCHAGFGGKQVLSFLYIHVNIRSTCY